MDYTDDETDGVIIWPSSLENMSMYFWPSSKQIRGGGLVAESRTPDLECAEIYLYWHQIVSLSKTYEPSRGKTNNVVSEEVRHKPVCTSTEKS